MAKVTEADATRVVKFLTTLRANWGKRFESDEAEDQWLNMMIGELHVFSEDVLTAAAKKLMRSKMDFFPRVGQCVDACVAEKRFLEGGTPELRDAMAKKAGRVKHESLAAELIMGPEGRTAAREGWIVGFESHILRHGRMPDQREKAKIIRDAEDVSEMLNAIWSGQDYGLGPVAQKVATNIQAKREELAKRVLGEA